MLSWYKFVVCLHNFGVSTFLMVALTAIQVIVIWNKSVVLHEFSTLQNDSRRRNQKTLIENTLIVREFGIIQLTYEFILHFQIISASCVGIVSFWLDILSVHVLRLKLSCLSLIVLLRLILNVIYLKSLELGLWLRNTILLVLILLILSFFCIFGVSLQGH